jgi:hypothetical protein
MQPTNDVAQAYPLKAMEPTEELKGLAYTSNTPLPEPEWGRLLSRQSYTQNTMLEGKNKKIVINDGAIDLIKIGYIDDDQTGIMLNDGLNNRILIGKFPDGNYGIVITKEGYSVEDVFS